MNVHVESMLRCVITIRTTGKTQNWNNAATHECPTQTFFNANWMWSVDLYSSSLWIDFFLNTSAFDFFINLLMIEEQTMEVFVFRDCVNLWVGPLGGYGYGGVLCGPLGTFALRRSNCSRSSRRLLESSSEQSFATFCWRLASTNAGELLKMKHNKENVNSYNTTEKLKGQHWF